MLKSVKLSAAAAVAIALLAFAGLSTQAFAAGSDTTSFHVKITINDSCNISDSAPNDIDFGTFNTVAAAKNAPGQTDLNVTCTQGLAATIALTPGNSDTTGAGVMTLNSNKIAYQLYQDSADSTVWGNASGNTESYMGTGMASTVPVYAEVTGTTEVPAGTYTDTVTATISY